MRGYLFVFLLIILLLTFINKNEHFTYRLINLAISNSGEIIVGETQSSIKNNIDCSDITTQNSCDSHTNVCNWVSQDLDSYSCISKCYSDELKNNQSLCIANPNCEFDAQNNKCEIKSIQTKQSSSNEDVCSLLETMDRCNINSNCVFKDGLCKSVDSIKETDNANTTPASFNCNMFSVQSDCDSYQDKCEWNGSICETKNTSAQGQNQGQAQAQSQDSQCNQFMSMPACNAYGNGCAWDNNAYKCIFVQSHGGNQQHNYQGNQQHNYQGSQQHNYQGNQPHNYQGNQQHNYQGNQQHNYQGNQPHSVQGNQPHSVQGNQPHSVQGNQPHSVQGNQ